MNTVTSGDGTSIAFERFGEGPPVILVGGATTDRAMTRPLAEELAKDFTVINYDRRGRGDSGDMLPASPRRARGRRYRRAHRRSRGHGVGVRPLLRRGPGAPRGGPRFARRQARHARAALRARQRGGAADLA